MPPPKSIVHLDADAFFASCEQAADSRLRGKPIAVGGEKRGIIASASYEARKFGIYTPMPTVRARKLCPKLIVISGDYDRYEHFSKWMFSYAYDFTPDVEQTSIDEGYFDLTGTKKSPAQIAHTIRNAIAQSLKISVSEGIGVNKLVSQIASKVNKPAAFFEVLPGQEIPFLHPLSNKWLPGIGPKAAVKLNAAGLAKIGHIAGTSLDLLHMLMGNLAGTLKQQANGVDHRPLISAKEPQKTYSQQETFERDLTDEPFIEATLRRMADDLFAKVREEGRSVRTLTVRVRYNDMDEDQCSESLHEPTDLETDIYSRLGMMLKVAWKRRVSLRLVSLKLSNVYDGRFKSELAFEVSVIRQEARQKLAFVVDELRRNQGHSAILRGHDFILREKPHESLAIESCQPIVKKRIIQVRPRIHYVPLRVHSHYSFLDSTLSPKTIVKFAKEQGMKAVAMTDTGNLHGAVEFTMAAREAGIKPILGVEILVEKKPLLLFVESAAGYHNLNCLLSRHAELAAKKDQVSVADQQRGPYRQEELHNLTEGLIAVSDNDRLAELFPDYFYHLVSQAEFTTKFKSVACPAIRYATPQDRQKFDIVQSIRTLTLLDQEHAEKRKGGKFHFRTGEETNLLCRDHLDWLEHSQEIADRCQFEIPFSKPQFPAYQPSDGSAPKDFLFRLAMEGLRKRYGNDADKYRSQVLEELTIIAEVGYEEYFLITWDFLQDCKKRGIEWITRGSAADSLVCYCLGISGVCPIRFDLYFRRFLNKDRMALHKLPDIDIDFAHDHKDDVVKLIFEKHRKDHCAVVGGFSTFQARSAFAEVAKVLGVAEREVRKFTDHFPWKFDSTYEAAGFESSRLIEHLRNIPECQDKPLDEEPYKTALQMADFLDGVPRYPKMHPCGVVLSRQPLHELTPTFIANKGYATAHFDMDAVEAIGLVKMDILAQGGLAAMRDVKQSLSKQGIEIDLEGLEPWQDKAVWEMIGSGGARAVHHIESPAMTSLCRMCDVNEIDGLIAIVSVIRPGAANEGKKLSFTRRYQGMEETTYPHPSLEKCLKSTYGLVVYEEHILQISEAFAGLSPGRADVLRRALNKQNRPVIEEIMVEFFESAKRRGHTSEKTAEVWDLVTGFAGYAFCKAHSTAYGVEAYQSAWLKKYHPIEFMAAVLSNSKGFYHPIVYILESHRLGITFLPPTINGLSPRFEREGNSIRVPVSYVKGLTEKTVKRIGMEREKGEFKSLADFGHRVAPTPDEMELLLRVGAFDEFHKPRTALFWEIQHLQRIFAKAKDGSQGLLLPPPGIDRLPEIPLQELTRHERLEAENELLGFPVSGHPLELHSDIAWDPYCPISELGRHIGEEIVTCGLVVEQRTHNQITGEPMKFLTIADWTGMVETELFAQTYRNYGLATVRYPVLEITAKVEPFENGKGFSLRVFRVRKPDRIKQCLEPIAWKLI